MARAKAAQLGGKDMWTKYPRQMLRARVISEGVRACYPAVLDGMYTPEEVVDMSPDERTATPRVSVKENVSAPQPEPENAPTATQTPNSAISSLPEDVESDIAKINAAGKAPATLDAWIIKARSGLVSGRQLTEGIAKIRAIAKDIK
jgi:hypothetical protein